MAFEGDEGIDALLNPRSILNRQFPKFTVWRALKRKAKQRYRKRDYLVNNLLRLPRSPAFGPSKSKIPYYRRYRRGPAWPRYRTRRTTKAGRRVLFQLPFIQRRTVGFVPFQRRLRVL